MTDQHLILVLGATATGKTALSLKLAQHFKSDILNVDSRQCYRELNIGTAKPQPEDLKRVKHHFIGHKSIHEDYSAGTYGREALAFCRHYFLNHNILVAVGGSGLYIKALCGDLDNYPKNKVLRRKIEQKFKAEGLIYLQETLRTLDEDYYQKIDSKNPRRLLRAIEIITLTGQKLSDTKKPISKIPCAPAKIIKIGLSTERAVLYERINKRVLHMLEAGLEKEAYSLRPYQALIALQTVGYREFFHYFKGNCSRDETIKLIQQNTRRYAKRQITWFKKEIDIHWFKPNQIDIIPHFLESILGIA